MADIESNICPHAESPNIHKSIIKVKRSVAMDGSDDEFEGVARITVLPS